MNGRAAVVGAGPNGLAGAVVLARAGLEVTVYEAAERVGGATRSGEVLGDGIVTDLGAAVHPFAVASPLLSRLPLEHHGLQWLHPDIPLAHPLEGRPAALLERSMSTTAEQLGRDGRAWRALHGPVVRQWESVVPAVLGPLLRVPKAPLPLAAFGLRGLWPAAGLARAIFRDVPARALFAGSASHAVVPLHHPLTAAFGCFGGGMTESKTRALLAGTALVTTVLWPVRQNWRVKPRGGFPLSYYPMFTARRRRTGTVVLPGRRHLTVLGVKEWWARGVSEAAQSPPPSGRTGRAGQCSGSVVGRPGRWVWSGCGLSP